MDPSSFRSLTMPALAVSLWLACATSCGTQPQQASTPVPPASPSSKPPAGGIEAGTDKSSPPNQPSPEPSPVEWSGICDASAAIWVAPGTFLVANDEDNALRMYSHASPGKEGELVPIYRDDRLKKSDANLNQFLRLESQDLEADIEGATRIGDVIYWMTSHGTNKHGEKQPNRRRLFATKVNTAGGKISISSMGKPYKKLIKDLSELKGYQLETAAERAPEEEGALNIEGLAATPEGALLIGFRNPIPSGHALIIPIKNPKDVVQGNGRVKLGDPIELPLRGMGIRSIEYVEPLHEYLIIAGPYNDAQEGFKLYRWTGDPKDKQPIACDGVSFAGLRPEALIVYPEEKTRVEVLSDDGTDDCKKAQSKRFRSLWVPLDRCPRP